ncbi:MAG: putative transrane permease [Ignavibacteria bacterium]|nr:putative transrane permease [Ignavibacteria bacterium]
MSKTNKRNPWLFIPTQYFAEGLPFVIVNQLSVALFKSLGASNAFIGATSFLYLPWSFKFLWSPQIDAAASKRSWVVWLQLALSIGFFLAASSLHIPDFTIFLLIIFAIIAFISASHDIVTDGFYLHALEVPQQAFFVGIRSTFYRLSMIFGSGLLIALAGSFGTDEASLRQGWSISIGICGIIFIFMFFYHRKVLPYPDSDIVIKRKIAGQAPYKIVFREYLSQKKIGVILSFILLYRFGEGLLLKMAQPFFLDKISDGGMGISLREVGIMYGTIGIIALMAGGIISGWIIKNKGLKKMLLPMAIIMNLPNLLFVYLAAVQPQQVWRMEIPWFFGSNGFNFHPVLQFCIVIEQFGYGMGVTAFMVYFLQLAKGTFKTSHYAISTGLMAIGFMLPGFLSGWLQQQIGYLWLFILSCIMTLPGMLTIFFLPIDEKE